MAPPTAVVFVPLALSAIVAMLLQLNGFLLPCNIQQARLNLAIQSSLLRKRTYLFCHAQLNKFSLGNRAGVFMWERFPARLPRSRQPGHMNTSKILRRKAGVARWNRASLVDRLIWRGPKSVEHEICKKILRYLSEKRFCKMFPYFFLLNNCCLLCLSLCHHMGHLNKEYDIIAGSH